MKELLELNPIICAIKGDEHLEDAANSDGDIVFLLNEDILTLKEKIQILHEHNKKVFVHIDMITGLSSSPIAVDYMKKEFNLDGIITTKTNIVKRAIELDLKVVQRFFFIDSMSLENAIESLKRVKPDAIEIMPGVIQKVIKKMNKTYPNVPIICGGLIDRKEEIIGGLSAGAMAISTTDIDMW
ncbi:glycerol-3-phosphate responsive antiterminator [Paraclostridium bifermentans]|uniref:glycerol-3-phosphate responsive antiterminator n=1 Tax=Paraclostridium bifermentans TaxID=1490 RepID=UPI00189ABEEA|nr:glycerol-3-phosphate responsive antiterminator [Paraclostridium bifermentans]MBS5954723.1 glycerol-3-phosphate responsive antiterminator [Paraclostridium bifermentans]MBU5289025.1 glycerol-3-phosphate responsive antiterminator [Paraclostridium bifermentans]MDU7904821.1 glycerol-3-phosphate responsive antiterminator [Peptostreptococcaceae bacterium]